MATTPDHDLPQSEHLPGTPRGRIGLIVVGSLAAGLFAALALVAAPFIPAKEGVLTGVVLFGFALGWALLAVLSVRLSDQPQGWAAAPAVFFALAGLISLLPPGSVVQKVCWTSNFCNGYGYAKQTRSAMATAQLAGKCLEHAGSAEGCVQSVRQEARRSAFDLPA